MAGLCVFPLSLSEIQNYFGYWGTSTDLQSYYRGGPHVPNVPQNLNIPTTGTIKISNFIGASYWPVDPTVIVSKIPTFSFTIDAGTGSDHVSSWYLNTSPGDPFYILAGRYDTHNGVSDTSLTSNSIAGGSNGDVLSSSPLGTIVRFQQFISQYCISGSSTGVNWAQAWIQHEPQSTGGLWFVWNDGVHWTSATQGGTEQSYADGGNPNTLEWVNGSGDSRLALPITNDGNGFVAAAIQLMLNYATVSGGAQNALLSKLRSYTWTNSTITSNFSDFANWMQSAYNCGVNNLILTSTASSLTQVGQLYKQTNVASGGTVPYTFSISSGTVPPGTTLNTLNGTISGTPTTSTIFSYTVTVSDSSPSIQQVKQAISGTIFTASTLTVTISAGVRLSGPTGSHSFPTNTFSVLGGTGPYVGTWSNTNDGVGTWNGPSTGTSFIPRVSGMGDGDISVATYICTVVDAYGSTGISNTATYSWTDNNTM